MSQVLTGARGLVKIKGTVVGFAGGINVTIENTLTDVDVMGQLEVGDLAETAHKCNFTINSFREIDAKGVSHNTAKAIKIDTSTPAAGVKPMRSQVYFDVEIEDEESGKTMFLLQQCKYEGGSGQVDARGLWQGTWNFKARKGFEVS